jgi:ribosomal protein S18 acetylase RimI-like enzyme
MSTQIIRYFKRYRMELDLTRPLPAVPSLPDGYFWLPWDDSLMAAHARAKFASFISEIDTQVFPSLGTEEGCGQLMRAIRYKPGFLPGATWLLASGVDYCGTVQGVRDRAGKGAIQNLGISAAHRGQGLGTALLLQALHGFQRACIQTALLEVTVENEAAIRIYRRLGFRCRKTVYKAVETGVYALLADEAIVR